MSAKGNLIRSASPTLLRLAFALHLRKSWSLFCRWLQQENARRPLFPYAAPGALESAMKFAFKYRKDPLNGTLDYTSHPEYIEALMRDEAGEEGDCDDGHWYVANCLKNIKDVTKVYFLSSGWDGPKGIGGHCTAVYEYFGAWYHFDWEIYELDDPNNAPQKVAERYGGEGAKVTFWVWESVGESGNDHSGWLPLAICPAKLKV